MMWNSTRNPHFRLIVLFCPLLMMAFQFCGSMNVIQPFWSNEDNIEAQRVEDIRKQTIQLLDERKTLLRPSFSEKTTRVHRPPAKLDHALPNSPDDNRNGADQVAESIKIASDSSKDENNNHDVSVASKPTTSQGWDESQGSPLVDQVPTPPADNDDGEDASINNTNSSKDEPQISGDYPNVTVRTNSSHDGPQSTQEEEDAEDPKASKSKPLNILILYPDDWRHDDIGGVAPVVRTPFLNELAGDGIRFTHNMVTTSICWVSRATLFTGQYVSRHKSYRLKTPEFYKTWHNTSWPALLQQQAGYFTGHVGKWQYHSPNGIVQNELFNYTKLFEGKHQYAHRGKVIPAAQKTQMEVQEFLNKRPKDRPFALTAAFYPPKAIGNSYVPGGQWFPQNITRATFYDNETIPHPYNETDAYDRLPYFFHRHERGARTRWKERFQGEERYQAAMKNYYSLITEVDTACRGIVNSLEKEGILNETLIIFTTDNGLFHAEHGLAGKWYPYQESIRVPLIIRDPRMPQEKRNTLDGSLTLNIDVNPTILGAAGLQPPESVQGQNIADLYLPRDEEKEETPQWREEFLYEFPLDNGVTMPMSSAVVRKDLKYIYWPQFKYEQIFNLTEDPLELTDLRKDPQYASVKYELRERHAELIEAVK